MAVRMFGAIRTESDSVKPTVQEALSSLAAAYKGCSAAVAKEVEALLLENAAAVCLSFLLLNARGIRSPSFIICFLSCFSPVLVYSLKD
jgi:proteasome component ECM29